MITVSKGIQSDAYTYVEHQFGGFCKHLEGLHTLGCNSFLAYQAQRQFGAFLCQASKFLLAGGVVLQLKDILEYMFVHAVEAAHITQVCI